MIGLEVAMCSVLLCPFLCKNVTFLCWQEARALGSSPPFDLPRGESSHRNKELEATLSNSTARCWDSKLSSKS